MPDPRPVTLELYAVLNARDFDPSASLLDAGVVATFDGSTLTGRAALTDHVAAAVREVPCHRC